MFRLFRLSRGSSSSVKTDTAFANDIDRQLAWLTEQSQAKGYQNLHELITQDLAEFVQLATEWRAQQSRRCLPRLLEWLYGAVQRVSAWLSSALEPFGWKAKAKASNF